MKIQGKRTAQELCSQLDNHVSRIDAALSNMRMNREDQNITRNLRQTQESAYQISLRKDQAKKMKSKIAEDKRLSEAHHVKTLKESKLTRIEGLRRNLKCEPEGNEGIAKLSIRLPNGTRLVRKFQGTDTLQVASNLFKS